MIGYTVFAEFYDSLMCDFNYSERADYLLSLFNLFRNDKKTNLILDLACGSGSMALEFTHRGIDVIGVDGSADMLSKAYQKAAKQNISLMLLNQDMCELDLYGTVNGAVCVLDSLNHICDIDDLTKVFKRLFLFIEPEGLFIFDVNTVYKHRVVLGNNAFVFEDNDFMCVWRNSLIKQTMEVDMQLDFFVPQDNKYNRFTECLRERAYSQRTLSRLLSNAGFDTLAVFDDMTTENVKKNSERMVFVAKRRFSKET